MKTVRAYCPRCLRPVTARYIPNRGVVMSHQNGEGGKRCVERANYIHDALTELREQKKG